MGLDFNKIFFGPLATDFPTEEADFSFINHPEPVLYDKFNQKRFLKSFFEETSKFIIKYLEKLKINKESNEAIHLYYQIGHYTLKNLLPFIKRPEFNEEREWRIVVNHNTFKAKKYYRVSQDIVMPYVKLAFYKIINEEGELDSVNIPIKEIIIGNSLEYSTARTGLEMLLKDRQLKDVEIKRSSIKFR